MPVAKRRAIQAASVCMLLAATACGGNAAPAGGEVASTATGASTNGVVVAGERFSTRVIKDPVQKYMAAAVVSVPASWTFDSKVTWDYTHTTVPVNVTMAATNPKNAEACTSFAPVMFFDLRPAGRVFQRGRDIGGMVFAVPTPALDTLAAAVAHLRGQEPHFTLVGGKSLPDLPKALHIPPAPNQEGVAVKVTYDWQGTPVEEEFYAVYYKTDIPYDGPMGRTWQINWGLSAFHSFRAPAGTLDSRRPVFAAIAKSYRSNPEWQQRVAATQQVLADAFNRQLKAKYDQIAAAAELSRQITANSNAFLANIDRQLQANAASRQSSGTEETPSRDYNAKFDDYIRGVETTDDPYYGTSQHAITEQFHWTDGYGNYRNTNDINYDPNRTEVGQWTQLKVIR